MGGKLLGPFFSEGVADLKKGRVYTLDGICLGKVRDLMVQSKRLLYDDEKITE
jgi:sporulation protein YlmC with PRC-barrel domain